MTQPPTHYSGDFQKCKTLWLTARKEFPQRGPALLKVRDELKATINQIQTRTHIAGRLAGFSSSVVYGAAKAAVIHLTRCVAMELGEAGIRVNSISPGMIATGILGKALGLSVEAAEKTPDTMRQIFRTAQPIPRAGLPEDIAHAAVFLASDESSFINGHDLVVDGAITGGRNWSQQQQGYVALRKAFDQGAG